MTYAKLINDTLSLAPNPIHIGTRWRVNPPASIYEAEGYKPVIYAPQPEAPSGYYYSETWTETEDAIVQGWEIVEAEVDPAEAMEILFGGGANEA